MRRGDHRLAVGPSRATAVTASACPCCKTSSGWNLCAGSRCSGQRVRSGETPPRTGIPCCFKVGSWRIWSGRPAGCWAACRARLAKPARKGPQALVDDPDGRRSATPRRPAIGSADPGGGPRRSGRRPRGRAAPAPAAASVSSQKRASRLDFSARSSIASSGDQPVFARSSALASIGSSRSRSSTAADRPAK